VRNEIGQPQACIEWMKQSSCCSYAPRAVCVVGIRNVWSYAREEVLLKYLVLNNEDYYATDEQGDALHNVGVGNSTETSKVFENKKNRCRREECTIARNLTVGVTAP
jgi:hypothetical protein